MENVKNYWIESIYTTTTGYGFNVATVQQLRKMIQDGVSGARIAKFMEARTKAVAEIAKEGK